MSLAMQTSFSSLDASAPMGGRAAILHDQR